MAIKYKVYVTPQHDGNAEKKYHVRVNGKAHSVTADDLAAIIATRTTLTRSDMKGALTALTELIVEQIGNGNRVYLNGLGYFRPILTTTDEVTPTNGRSAKVSVRTLAFRPDKSMRKALQSIHTVYDPTTRHPTNISDEAIRDTLSAYFLTHDTLTRKTFEELFDLTRGTALRRIRKLVDNGTLINVSSQARFPLYKLCPEA